jgi:large subunit ribosomal protein L15
MQIHELKPQNKSKKKKRVGRGGKRGTYCGRGSKGQKSRAGSGGKNMAEKGRSSWVKRLPKLGGFRAVQCRNYVIKTNVLEEKFKDGDKVDPEVLLKIGIVDKLKRGRNKKLQRIKILKAGSLKKKLTISGCLVSKTAREDIEKAGGKIEEIKKENQKSKKIKKEKNKG